MHLFWLALFETAFAALVSNGTGQIPPSRFVGVDWKAATAPAFVTEFRLPTVSPSLLAKTSASSAVQGSAAELAEIREVDSAIESEIRSSGVLKPLTALGKKYDESQLASMFAAAVKLALDPETDGRPARGSAAPPSFAAFAGADRKLLGFFDDLWDAITGFVADVGCTAFAAGATPGYLLAYSLFHAKNSGYSKLTSHQKFFARAGGFSSDLLSTVNVKYSAWMAPGFGGAGGVTMGKEIYIKGAKANEDANPITNMDLSSAFWSQTRLLMHEMGHSKQYAARNWNFGKFGWDYMFQFCKAGFSYSKNSLEKDAETYRDNSEAIMKSPATAHFKKVRKDNLFSTVGFSKNAAEYTNFKIGSTAIMSLDLVKDVSKLGESQRKAGTFCVRVLSGTSLAQRTKAEITGKPWDCVNVKPTPKPTKKPTPRPTNKPTPKPTPRPTGPTAPPTFPIVSATKPPGLGLKPTNRPTTKAPTVKIPL